MDATERFLARNYRRNFIVNALDFAFWGLGASFVSTATILPVFISHLTSNPLWIGLLPALESFGWFLPQLFVAPFVERLPRQYPWVLVLGFIERVPFPLLGVAIWFFPHSANGDNLTALLIFFALFALQRIGGGLVAMPWQEMLARVIPARSRGRFFGTGLLVGGVLGVIGAIAAERVLVTFEYPTNYAVLFFAAFGGVMISFGSLTFTREPRHPVKHTAQVTLDYWKNLPGILRADRNFREFLISRALGYLGSMAGGFYAVAAVKQFGLGDNQAAIFAAILLGSSTLSNVVWGLVGDRWGHKRVLEGSSLLGAFALVVALLAPSVVAYYIVFALAGAANAGFVIGELSIVMEFTEPARRPTYIGLARSLLAPWIGIAPLLGGVVLESFGYVPLLVAALVFTVIGSGMLVGRVREPRDA
jgi:MFS family permease